MGEIKKLGGKTSTGLDITTAFATFATKEELKESQQGILATHRITNVYGVIDSAINTTQDIQVVGTGFGIFSDNNIRVLLNNLITGESIEGKYTYTMTYVDTQHIILHFNITDVVTDGSYVLYLGDVNGSIYLNPANTGSEALIKIGGYTQLDFNTWNTNPVVPPVNFVTAKNNVYVGTTNQPMAIQLYPAAKSVDFIPSNKNFELTLNISDTYLRITGLQGGTFLSGIIGITTNSNLSVTSTDINVGYLLTKPIDYNNGDKAKRGYYSLAGGLTELISTKTSYSINTSVQMLIKGSLTQLFITIVDSGTIKSYTIPRPSGDLYIKAISTNLPYSHAVNDLNIGATINCKIW